MLSRSINVVLLTCVVMLVGSCGDRRPIPKREKRVVLVYDPTVLTIADSVVLQEGVLRGIHDVVAALPTRTTLDMYMVGEDNLQVGAQFRGSLTLDKQRGGAARKERAKKMADSLTRLAESGWREAHVGPERPASCILSAIRRAGSALTPWSRTMTDTARVALVIVSDLMEACDDFGQLNFERSIPKRLGDLPDRVDLSGVESIYVVKVKHPLVGDVPHEMRLDSVWVELLTRWGADRNRIHLDKQMPSNLFAAAK